MSTQTSLTSSGPQNPKGIPASSPGLRGTSYPGNTSSNLVQPQRGCGLSVSCVRAESPSGDSPGWSRAARGGGPGLSSHVATALTGRHSARCGKASRPDRAAIRRWPDYPGLHPGLSPDGLSALIPRLRSSIGINPNSEAGEPRRRGARPSGRRNGSTPVVVRTHFSRRSLLRRERRAPLEAGACPALSVSESGIYPCPSNCHRALSSLAPIGGEARGEGARRTADQGAAKCQSAPARLEFAHATVSSARPLTLTLSPDGGEGICAPAISPSPSFLFPIRVHPRCSAGTLP